MLQINTKYLEQPQNQWVDHWKIKHQQTFAAWLKMKLNENFSTFKNFYSKIAHTFPFQLFIKYI